uniref:Uncharacterized protein n=1 Tax=Musca domestica TaxID=7370 RepID=A0A1I8NJS7_MUSDO
MKAKALLKEYKVIARKLPSEKEPQSPLYKMRIFSPDNIFAKFRFWYFLRQLKKFKKTTGEIVAKHLKSPPPSSSSNEFLCSPPPPLLLPTHRASAGYHIS